MQKNWGDHDYKGSVVSLTNAVIDPNTVMIEFAYTSNLFILVPLASFAMFGSQRTVVAAIDAVR